ncbi:hypothetical protein CDD80_2085 [Ophiocordyceps camponoti-rufipedis]|uniref:Uncharacterized protein n=1 Tax=Ophiocordyceps camponoti-rufipedis TaxID=2004952 RepID=A0A2C5Z404_9HYPO|nr:hypothetical protein CDD80_2085 [Ophiocordyceps camponoti-rufipedis]
MPGIKGGPHGLPTASSGFTLPPFSGDPDAAAKTPLPIHTAGHSDVFPDIANAPGLGGASRVPGSGENDNVMGPGSGLASSTTPGVADATAQTLAASKTESEFSSSSRTDKPSEDDFEVVCSPDRDVESLGEDYETSSTQQPPSSDEWSSEWDVPEPSSASSSGSSRTPDNDAEVLDFTAEPSRLERLSGLKAGSVNESHSAEPISTPGGSPATPSSGSGRDEVVWMMWRLLVFGILTGSERPRRFEGLQGLEFPRCLRGIRRSVGLLDRGLRLGRMDLLSCGDHLDRKSLSPFQGLGNLDLSRLSGLRGLLDHHNVPGSPSHKHPLGLTSLSGRKHLPQLGHLQSLGDLLDSSLLSSLRDLPRGNLQLPRFLGLSDLLSVLSFMDLLDHKDRSGRGSLPRLNLQDQDKILSLSLHLSRRDLLGLMHLPDLTRLPGLVSLPSWKDRLDQTDTLRRQRWPHLVFFLDLGSPLDLPPLSILRDLLVLLSLTHTPGLLTHPQSLMRPPSLQGLPSSKPLSHHILLPAHGYLPSFKGPPSLMELSSPEDLLLTLGTAQSLSSSAGTPTPSTLPPQAPTRGPGRQDRTGSDQEDWDDWVLVPPFSSWPTADVEQASLWQSRDSGGWGVDVGATKTVSGSQTQTMASFRSTAVNDATEGSLRSVEAQGSAASTGDFSSDFSSFELQQTQRPVSKSEMDSFSQSLGSEGASPAPTASINLPTGHVWAPGLESSSGRASSDSSASASKTIPLAPLSSVSVPGHERVSKEPLASFGGLAIKELSAPSSVLSGSTTASGESPVTSRSVASEESWYTVHRTVVGQDPAVSSGDSTMPSKPPTGPEDENAQELTPSRGQVPAPPLSNKQSSVLQEVLATVTGSSAKPGQSSGSWVTRIWSNTPGASSLPAPVSRPVTSVQGQSNQRLNDKMKTSHVQPEPLPSESNDPSLTTETRTYTVSSCAPTVTDCPIGRLFFNDVVTSRLDGAMTTTTATKTFTVARCGTTTKSCPLKNMSSDVVVVATAVVQDRVATASSRPTPKPTATGQPAHVKTAVTVTLTRTMTVTSCASGTIDCGLAEVVVVEATVPPQRLTSNAAATPTPTPGTRPDRQVLTTVQTLTRTYTIVDEDEGAAVGETRVGHEGPTKTTIAGGQSVTTIRRVLTKTETLTLTETLTGMETEISAPDEVKEEERASVGASVETAALKPTETTTDYGSRVTTFRGMTTTVTVTKSPSFEAEKTRIGVSSTEYGQDVTTIKRIVTRTRTVTVTEFASPTPAVEEKTGNQPANDKIVTVIKTLTMTETLTFTELVPCPSKTATKSNDPDNEAMQITTTTTAHQQAVTSKTFTPEHHPAPPPPAPTGEASSVKAVAQTKTLSTEHQQPSVPAAASEAGGEGVILRNQDAQPVANKQRALDYDPHPHPHPHSNLLRRSHHSLSEESAAHLPDRRDPHLNHGPPRRTIPRRTPRLQRRKPRLNGAE